MWLVGRMLLCAAFALMMWDAEGASPPLILQVVDEFRQAARNAVDAGFNGVEIHGANVSV